MDRSTLRGIAGFAACAALGALLAACGGDSGGGATVKAGSGQEVELVNEDQLTVCTHLPYEPFQFRKGDEIVGFDVDLMDRVARRLGVEQQIVDTPFEGIQSGEDLNALKCDAAAAGMTITDEREKKIDFSDPYFDATQALVVKKGAPYAGLEDLKGETVGVQDGTTGEIYAQEHAPEGVELRTYEDLALLLSAVKTGQIPAAINDSSVLYPYIKENPDTAVATEFDTGEQYGIGVREKGSEALLTVINKTLAESRSDGSYDEIYRTWFGEAPEK
ncbi:MAG: ABC transporter substrate-binding protein [Carbonactinosporaceae bacterium]